MGLCVLYYVEYSLYNVKKVGFFYLGWNYTLKCSKQRQTDLQPHSSIHPVPSNFVRGWAY